MDKGILLTEDAAIQARCTEAFAAVNRFEEAHNMVTKVSAGGSSTQRGVCMSRGAAVDTGSHGRLELLKLPMNRCAGLATHQRGSAGRLALGTS